MALLEWYQQFIPGPYPDITDVVVAMGIWWLASGFPAPGWQGDRVRDKRALPLVVNAEGATQRPLVLLACLLLAATAYIFTGEPVTLRPLTAYPTSINYRHRYSRDFAQPTLACALRVQPRFGVSATWNPRLWIRHGKPRSKVNCTRILMARVEPGSVDTAELHGELMKLEPSGRGQEQTSMLALGYDWLYGEWNPAQRQALLDKVARACRYQVEVIRNKYSLSPYNVYLYNRPLQALLMAALASHGDASDDSCMRFTADWKNRVYPCGGRSWEKWRLA